LLQCCVVFIDNTRKQNACEKEKGKEGKGRQKEEEGW